MGTKGNGNIVFSVNFFSNGWLEARSFRHILRKKLFEEIPGIPTVLTVGILDIPTVST